MTVLQADRATPFGPAMRVLILAPDQPPAHLLRKSLEQRGCAAAHVTTAQDADAFLALWNTHAVVVAEGASAEIREMVARSPSRPVLLVMSGLADDPPSRSGSTVLGVLDAIS